MEMSARTDPNQCLTASKVASTILVTAGIVVFTVGKQRVASHLLATSDVEQSFPFC